MLPSNELWRCVISLNLTLFMNLEKSVVNGEPLFMTIHISFPCIRLKSLKLDDFSSLSN